MRRKRWALIGAAVAAGFALAAVAQERAGEVADAPTPPSENLRDTDADVIDATSTVEAPAAVPQAEPAAWPVRDLTPPDLGPLQITLHEDGPALVRDRRTFAVHVGENRLTVKGVPRRIVADSVRLRPLGDPAALVVVEQTVQAPAVSSAALLEAAIGQQVRVRDERYTFHGTLLAVEDGGVVIGSPGEIHIHPEGEVVVPSATLPDPEPQILWVANAPVAGEVEAELSYLADGLTWQADYTLTTLDNDRAVAFEGWITVKNESGAAYDQAGLIFAESAEGADGAEAPRRYYLPRKVSLPVGATKRFALVQTPRLRATTRYVADLAGSEPVRLIAELTNDAASGLGVPLPPGPVRLYAPDRVGRFEYRGEQALPATAVDAAVPFDLGLTDDVELRVESKPLPADATGAEGLRRVVKLRNLRTEDVVVRLVERRDGDWRVAGGTAAFTPPRDGRATAEVPVPANRVAEVSYELRWAVRAARERG